MVYGGVGKGDYEEVSTKTGVSGVNVPSGRSTTGPGDHLVIPHRTKGWSSDSGTGHLIGLKEVVSGAFQKKISWRWGHSND